MALVARQPPGKHEGSRHAYACTAPAASHAIARTKGARAPAEGSAVMAKAPSLQGGSGKGHNRLPGQNEGGWPPRPCPECMKLFEPKVANQLFCQPDHNNAWTNRATKRGRVLTPLSIVARVTRDGTRGTPEEREAGRSAAKQQRALIQRYRDEDRAANDGRGRMKWPEFHARRLALGFDPLS